MTDPLVTFTVENGVGYVVLNRPNQANAFNVDFCRELNDIAIRCDEDAGIRAVHLTGAGRMFSAGGDLRAFAADGGALSVSLKRMTTYLHSALARLARMKAPLVIAVNGPAAGAGFSLSLLGDLVFCGKSASFVLAYSAAGLSPDGGSTYLLPRVVGLRRAQELIFANRRLTASEAVEWGVATQVVDDDKLLETSHAAARALAAGPTTAYGAARALLQSSAAAGYETQMEHEARSIAAMAMSKDGQEGIAAFLAKRPANFVGQ